MQAESSAELRVTATSLHDQTILINPASEWDLRVQIVDSNGRQVPLTDYGRRVAAEERWGSLRKHTLARAEQFTQSLDLSKLYALSGGSAYRVTVFREAVVGGRTVELQATTTIQIP
jgi:hypothetical protein